MNGEADEKTASGEVVKSPGELEAVTGPASQVAFPAATLKHTTLGRAAPLIIGAVVVFALVAAGVYFAKRQLNLEGEGDEATQAETAPAVTIDLPAPAETPLAGDEPPPDKIFNAATDGLKTGADAIKRAAPSVDGSINELPPAPASSELSANAKLQDAAKDAAKLLAPKSRESSEIDLSAPEPEAALETLERAANAHASSSMISDFPASGETKFLNSENSRSNEGEADLLRLTEQQALEIARLKEELAKVSAAGAPEARQAKAALLFNSMAEKARRGEVFRQELDAFSRESGVAPAISLDAAADQGVATLTFLKAEFPIVRDGALAEERRVRANGPVSSIAANAASLVRLRPASPIGGSSPEAIFSRAEARLAVDDLAGALIELESLVGAARDFASGWVDKSTERVEVEAALSATNDALLAALEAERN